MATEIVFLNGRSIPKKCGIKISELSQAEFDDLKDQLSCGVKYATWDYWSDDKIIWENSPEYLEGFVRDYIFKENQFVESVRDDDLPDMIHCDINGNLERLSNHRVTYTPLKKRDKSQLT